MDIGSVEAGKGSYGLTVYKFGFNAAITTDEETVWDAGGLYSYLSAATAMSIVSTDANDSLAGSGAQKITLEGLDEDWMPQIVEVEMGGATPATTEETFIRVYRAYVTQAGAGEVNAGDITISGGGSVRAQLSEGQGQTLMAVYTVPAGYTGYITGWTFSSGATASNKYLDGRLIVRSNDGIIRTKARTTIANTTMIQDFDKATKVNEKDDVEVRAVTSSGTDAVSGTFTMLMSRN